MKAVRVAACRYLGEDENSRCKSPKVAVNPGNLRNSKEMSSEGRGSRSLGTCLPCKTFGFYSEIEELQRKRGKRKGEKNKEKKKNIKKSISERTAKEREH